MGFLRKKLSDVSIGHLLFLECEGWLYALFVNWPGAIGMTIRNMLYFLLFKKKRGFIYVQPRVTIVESNKFVCGRNCAINTGSYINAKGGIIFGDNVLVGSNVTISSGKHDIEGKEPPVFQRPTIPEQIIIEDDVWIGANAVIMPGVTLRKGSVVGAGAIVTKDTVEYSVVAGVPARHIRYRYE